MSSCRTSSYCFGTCQNSEFEVYRSWTNKMSSRILIFFCILQKTGESSRQPVLFSLRSSDGGNRKDVCYDVESLFWSFGNWIWHSTHDHLSQRGIVCVRCDVLSWEKINVMMTFCGGFLLEIFAKCKQIIEEYVYKFDSPWTTNRRAMWRS